jgi:hypothetical protein
MGWQESMKALDFFIFLTIDYVPCKGGLIAKNDCKVYFSVISVGL